MATMRAWQLRAPGNIASTLELNEKAAKPALRTPDDVLVKVSAAALNPADYKVPEFGIVSRSTLSYPKIVGMDFTGIVEQVGEKVSDIRTGDRVLGFTSNNEPGPLADFAVVHRDRVARISDKVEEAQAAGLGVTNMTSSLALKRVKPGDKVFLNGGSGGVGTAGIQIAKNRGAEVTVSCSSGKRELCKSLGADVCIDYTSTNLVEELTKEGPVYDLVVDNVGDNPRDLALKAHLFTKPEAEYLFIGGSLKGAGHLISALLLPTALGGSKRKTRFLQTEPDREALAELTQWLEEGKLKVVVDETFEFAQLPDAYAKLKKGSSRGKIIIKL